MASFKKKKTKNIIIASTFIFLIISFVVILFNSNNTEYVKKPNVDNWYNDISSGKQVVTVIGLTTCQHCQAYKPVIKSLANNEKFELYFFESDLLSDGQANKLINSFDLKDYDGYVPYTFIFKDNEYISGKVGYSNKNDIIDFLKKNNVIKN